MVEKESILQKHGSGRSGLFFEKENGSSDPLDEANANTLASYEIRLRNRDIIYLKKVEQGLERIKSGLYGLCADCEGKISFERLLARPTAEQCIICKEESEIVERGRFSVSKSGPSKSAFTNFVGDASQL